MPATRTGVLHGPTRLTPTPLGAAQLRGPHPERQTADQVHPHPGELVLAVLGCHGACAGEREVWSVRPCRGF